MTSTKHPTPPPRDLQITTTTTTNASSSVTLHHLSSSSTRPPSRIASASGQNQACAACKYQRRKCNPDCPLARYFPADQQRRFLNAHRLFGVGNIQRTLRETPPELRNDAMRALIYQAEVRAYDPVGGCYRVVQIHSRELYLLRAERDALKHHLKACRTHQLRAQQALVDDGSGSGMMMLVGAEPHASDMPLDDALYAAAAHEIDYGQPSADHYLLAAADPPHPHQLYDYPYSYYDGQLAGDDSSSHAWSNNMQQQQQHYGNNNGIIVKDGSPVASLGDDQIETQFVDVFDVKPDIAVATAVGMEHDAGSDDSFDHQLEEKVVATVVKHELLDHQAAASQMAAESSAAVSRCQLELGFSSF
uniref:Uncharacterized protein n=1 Tax=Avena sativa TaxID=4498 RepID=A0ACD5Y302_AVESA